MLMFPVEYIIGDPLPFVSSFEFLTVTVPSPLSVASVAQLPPCVVISTFSASIYPPYVASSPLDELLPVVFIFESFIYIFESVPVENTALLPFAFVSIVAFFIVAVEFWVTSIPEFYSIKF